MPNTLHRTSLVLYQARGIYRSWWSERLKAEEARGEIRAPLYHYTNAAALRGILTEKQIWLTKAASLDDDKELVYGFNLAIDALIEAVAFASPRAREFADFYLSKFSLKKLPEIFSFYFACFCRSPDSDSQWNDYGCEDTAFAITFNPEFFGIETPAPTDPDKMVLVGHVIYGLGDVKTRHRTLFDKALAMIGQPRVTAQLKHSIARDLFFERLAIEISSGVIWNCVTAKDQEFNKEDEVRLIMMNQRERLQTYERIGKGKKRDIYYVPYQFPASFSAPVGGILVGAKAPATALNTARQIANEAGLPSALPISIRSQRRSPNAT